MNRIAIQQLAAFMLALVVSTQNGCSAPQQPTQPASKQTTPSPALSPRQQPRQGHWGRYAVNDGERVIDVYLAHDSQPKPVVMLIQGSGCAPIMTMEADGALNDTSLFQALVSSRLSRLHFALIEKRGVDLLRFSSDISQAQKLDAFERATVECSGEYLRSATKPLRVADVLATIRALRRQPWVQSVIVAGHSEGTHVATGIVHETKGNEIAAAGLFASAGPTQFFGEYLAGGETGDPARLRTIFDHMRLLQSADDDFMYEGLPARRWKTFALDSTPIEDVRDSEIPLFVAQGSRDGSTLRADLFVLEAIRQRPNRPLWYVVVPDADHTFDTPSGTKLPQLFDDFIRWSLDARRETGVTTLE